MEKKKNEANKEKKKRRKLERSKERKEERRMNLSAETLVGTAVFNEFNSD